VSQLATIVKTFENPGVRYQPSLLGCLTFEEAGWQPPDRPLSAKSGL
jgi:hypothetical protein